MKPEWIGFAVIVALGLLQHWMPLLTRRDLFFGVTVAPSFRDGEAARALLRSYRYWVWVPALLALALLLWSGPRQTFVAVVLQLGCSTVGYARTNAAARAWRVEPGGIREATLLGRDTVLAEHPLALSGPVLLLALCAMLAFALSDWSTIVAHGAESPFSFSSGVLVGVGFGLLVVRFGTRRKPAGVVDLRKRILSTLLLICYLVALYAGGVLVAAALGYTVTREMSRALMAVVLTVVVVHTVMILLASRREASAAAGAVPGDGTPDECWKWGLLYCNPADPALMVQKRWGLGYTLNFGRPASWVLLCGVLVLLTVVGLDAARKWH